MPFIDYYKVLGLEKNAGTGDIRKAYRKLARKHHPDLNPNDETAKQKFQQINEANEVLSDPENRRKYDQYSAAYGENWRQGEQYEQARQQQNQQGGGSGGYGDFAGAGDGNFSDFFESMFGHRGGGRQAAFRGQDVEASLQISLRDAATTHKQTFTINGRQVRISIPAGVANGQKIRLKGYGNPGAQGGPAGDLFITFSIQEDPQFRRLGDDIYSDAGIDLYTAVLGGDAVVATLDGQVRLKVKAGTRPDEKQRLKGKGFPVYKQESAKGDLYVTFRITIPQHLSEQEQELFRQLAALRPQKTS